MTPITVGLSGAATYAVKTSRGDFVLKARADDPATWARATSMQRLAAEAGVAPPLVHVDEERAASVSVKVDGIPLGQALGDPNIRPRAIADVLQRVRKLQAIPLPADALLPDVATFTESIWQSQANREGFPRWALSLGPRLAEANAVLATDVRHVFGHGDLHPANVFWDGTRTWFLDWDRAGPAHPYADLATFSNFLDLPDDAGLALLAALRGGEVDERERQVFRAARQRSRIVYGAVFLRLVPDLTQMSFGEREQSPTYAECRQRMANGTLRIGTAEGHALIGAALLRASS